MTVVFFVGDINYFFPKSESKGVKTYVEPNTVFKIVKDSSKVLCIESFNNDFDILTSINGGDEYKLYRGDNLLDINSEDLTKKDVSIRSKKVFGELPTICSVLVKAKHKSKSIYTRPVLYNNTGKFETMLPIVSLAINEHELFDEFDGIMNFGNESWFDESFYNSFWDRNANFKKRGAKSEKHVYFEFIENHHQSYSAEAVIQISGNATRSFPQKSFKIKARQQFDKPIFEYPFFGKNGNKSFKSLVIRNSGNDNTKTLFADLFMQKMGESLSVLTQKGKPIHVFINGNYWGIYNLRERYDTYLIAQHEKVKEDEVTILEGGYGELKSGSKKQQKKYSKFLKSIENNLNDNFIKEIKDEIDLESFTQYILIETFFGNSDWVDNNVMWYKAGNKKWKWILNDLDFGMSYLGKENQHKNYFEDLNNSNSVTAILFKKLIANKKYKNEFVEAGRQLIKEFYDDDRIIKTFNNCKAEIESDLIWQTCRWRGNFDSVQWQDNCQNNLEFIKNRKSVFEKQLDNL
jgi:hypothetical protein